MLRSLLHFEIEILMNSTMEPHLTNFTSVSDFYHQIWHLRDRRMDNYYLMNNPLLTLILCSFYVIFSLYLGPLLMKNRKPYNIKPLIIVYNGLMLVTNAYLFYQGWTLGWSKYKLMCEPVDTSNTPHVLFLTKLVYAYFLTKFIDWLDTLFFILSKKFSHVSVLHVYHHCCMPINIWPVARFLPGGHATLLGLINTFVHVIMHLYYVLSALGPKLQKYLWWKKYLTIMQIVQFTLIGIHFIYGMWLDCGFPRKAMYFYFPQVIIMTLLFLNFYKQTYKKKQM